MKKFSKVALTIFVLALLVGAALFALRPSEPAYRGRTLRSWLKEFDGGYESADTNAIAAIQAIGTNGLPVLLRELTYKESVWRRGLRELADKLPIIKLSLEPPLHRNLRAAEALYVLGEEKRAIPVLVGLMFQSDTALPAAITLARFGQDALPQFASALSFTNETIRIAALWGLGSWRGDDAILVPLVVKALTDESDEVRWNAADFLGETRREPGTVVPALIKALGDKVPRVRGFAATALGKFGKDAEPALPALRKLKEQEGARSRMASYIDEAVKNIQEESKDK